MTMPLVSVCIPTYNNLSGLLRTLICIKNQSYKNLEIIISDNHSPDPIVWKTILECASNDKRIRAYQQEENIGVDENYQFVFNRAKGTYCMFAQDDDWWSSSFIEKLVDELEQTGAPVAISNAQYINSNGIKSGIHTFEHVSPYNVIGNGEIGFICMGLWRREAYKKYIVRIPIFVIGGDHITIAQVMMATGKEIPVVHSELYLKGLQEGRFSYCFNIDFWYSFKTWCFLMMSLLWTPFIPRRRKLLLPIIGITNLVRVCGVMGVQILCMLPDGNIVKRMIQKKFFGAN